jgi:hypothetical protein
MKVYKFWDIGRNKNLIEELFIWIFHKHYWEFWKIDEYRATTKWHRCNKCGLIKVEEHGL